MIIQNGKITDVLTSGGGKSMDMEVDVSDMATIMSIFTESIYKDAIGSIVRETASNALDSHRAAGKKEPIIVKLGQKNGAWYFSVEDFGTGFTPEAVDTVLRKYFASTKRESNEFIGGWGVGFKSPLAYTNSFTFTTVVDNVKYDYIMYKGDEGNKLDLIHQQPTENGNGTIVEVRLKNPWDYSAFSKKLREQLAYFDDVYIVDEGSPINNADTKIYKGDDWKMSSLSTVNEMHLILDNVYYQLDYTRLGIDRISVPIGLNFKVGEGLIPTVSREEIRYPEEARKIILDRIRKIATSFVERYNKEGFEAENFEQLFNKFGQQPEVMIAERSINIAGLLKYSEVDPVQPTMKGVSKLDLKRLVSNKDYILNNFEVRCRITNQRKFQGKDGNWTWNVDYIREDQAKGYILCKERPKGVQLDYLKDHIGQCNFVFQKGKMRLKGDFGYIRILNLDGYKREDWRQVIKEFQMIRDACISRLRKLEDIKPTDEWLAIRKAGRAQGSKTYVNKEEINPKYAERSQRGGQNATFNLKLPITLGDASKLKGLYVYGKVDDKERLDSLFGSLSNYEIRKGSTRRVWTAIVTERDFTRLEKAKLHNWINIDKFMQGDNKPFRAFATAFLVEKLKEAHPRVWTSYGVTYIKELNKDLGEKLEKLDKYLQSKRLYTDQKLKEAILKTALDYNLWDLSIMDIYHEVEEKLPTFNFMEYLKGVSDETHKMKEAVKIGAEILKYRKFKLDSHHYPPPVKEEAVEDTDLIAKTLDAIEEPVSII